MTQPYLPRTYSEPVWTDDLDPNGRETQSDLESLIQDTMHIISETLGSNAADPDNGVGAVNYLGGTSVQLAQMPGIIDAQLAGVTRIAGSKSSIALQTDGTYRIFVSIGVAGAVVNLQFSLGPNGLSRV